MKGKIKKILGIIVATGSLVAGVFVFKDNQPPQLTWNEYQTLIKIYQYEIEQAGGEIELTNVKGDIIKALNDELLLRTVKENEVFDGEPIKKIDYEFLRANLLRKTEKTLNK